MRILLLSETIEGADAEPASRVRYVTAKALSGRGHDVTFIHPSNCSARRSVRAERDGLQIISTPGVLPERWRRGGFSIIDAISKSFYTLFGKYDVIHVTGGHRPAQLVPCLVGKWLRGSAIIDEWWEWFGIEGIGGTRKGLVGKVISRYDSLLELPSKRFYDGVIAISGVLKRRLGTSSNVIVVHGGAEPLPTECHDMIEARDQLGLGKELFIVGLSSFAEADLEDNVIFLEAFERLAREYDHIRLFVTGKRSFVRECFGGTSYEDKIVYPGWLSFEDYNRYLCACSLFVLPLRNTPRNAGRWPNKIGDYVRANRPIISNPTGDIADLFSCYRIGVTCEESGDGFYDALRALVEEGAEVTKHCGDSFFVATEVLSFDGRINSILQFYQQCLRARK